jgi:hypothetical protein
MDGASSRARQGGRGQPRSFPFSPASEGRNSAMTGRYSVRAHSRYNIRINSAISGSLRTRTVVAA